MPRSFMDLPYLKFFNLAEEPFSTVPSPRFFFLSPTHAMALEKTSFVVGANKGLTTVFGDTGTGKSSLARLLHEKFTDNGFNSALLTNPNYPTPFSLLRTIAQEFGIKITHRSYKGMIDIFKDFLFMEAIDNDKTVVLIIDEAQTLTPQLIELLRQLINYETNDVKLLQLVLFAQEELRDTISRPKLRNFRSRIVFASTLDALTYDETKSMISFRWTVASGGANQPFTDDAIRIIYERSAGMPREANILADNALLISYYKKEREISAETVLEIADDRHQNLSRRGAA
jgi:general secretion pathway protein A